MLLFTCCIREMGVATYSKYLKHIDRLQKRAFRFGNIQQVTPEGSCGIVLWTLPRIPCRIFSHHVRTRSYAIVGILTGSNVLKQKDLRNALSTDVSLILNR